MARYLSEEWFEELNAAARSSAEVSDATAGAHLTLQQIVARGPDHEIRYWVRVDDGTVAAGLGEVESPDATIVQPWETAVAIVTGELEVHAALMSGRVKITGNMAPLMESQSALQGLNTAFAEVRDRTSFE